MNQHCGRSSCGPKTYFQIYFCQKHRSAITRSAKKWRPNQQSSLRLTYCHRKLINIPEKNLAMRSVEIEGKLSQITQNAREGIFIPSQRLGNSISKWELVVHYWQEKNAEVAHIAEKHRNKLHIFPHAKVRTEVCVTEGSSSSFKNRSINYCDSLSVK